MTPGTLRSSRQSRSAGTGSSRPSHDSHPGSSMRKRPWRAVRPRSSRHARGGAGRGESSPSQLFSPDGTRLAYSLNTWDGAFLEVQMLGSENRLRLTKVRTISEIGSAWSPDGRQLVFARTKPPDDRGLFLVSSMGGPERKLRSLAPWPFPQRLVDWSPDGKWIVFADESPATSRGHAGKRGPNALFLLSVESLEARQLTTPEADEMGDAAPVFSPDGSSIAFVHTTAASFDEIRVMPAQGGAPSTVVSGRGWSNGLTWSADGRSLIFDRTDAKSPFRLWRVPSHGGFMAPVPIGSEAELMSPVAWRDRLAYEVRQFTLAVARVSLKSGGNAPPEAVVASTRSDHAAHYSPQGDRIAFLSSRTGSEELWVADASGKNSVQLTHLGLSPLDTAWAPDGQSVAITTSAGSVHIVSIETGRERTVPLDTAYLFSTAAFSRDGRSLYVASQPASRQALLKVPLDGGSTIKVLDGVVNKVAETPDGRTLLYSRQDPFGGKPPGIWKRAINETDETFVMPASANWDIASDGVYVLRDSGEATEPDPHNKGPAIERYSLRGRYLQTVARLGRYDANYPLSIAPDGRSALFSHIMTNSVEIDMVEGYK